MPSLVDVVVRVVEVARGSQVQRLIVKKPVTALFEDDGEKHLELGRRVDLRKDGFQILLCVSCDVGTSKE